MNGPKQGEGPRIDLGRYAGTYGGYTEKRTNTKPEALQLADEIDGNGLESVAAICAAAELRRLHAENESLTAANEQFGKRQDWWNERMFVLEQQRDALLEALKFVIRGVPDTWEGVQKARAAIKSVEENT